jgi:hypothetical protein
MPSVFIENIVAFGGKKRNICTAHFFKKA